MWLKACSCKIAVLCQLKGGAAGCSQNQAIFACCEKIELDSFSESLMLLRSLQPNADNRLYKGTFVQ